MTGGWAGELASPAAVSDQWDPLVQQFSRVWLVEFYPGFWDPQGLIEATLQQHYRLVETLEFADVTLKLFARGTAHEGPASPHPWAQLSQFAQRREVRLALKGAVLALVVLFVAYAVYTNWSELQQYEWQADWRYVLLAALFFILPATTDLAPGIASWPASAPCPG